MTNNQRYTVVKSGDHWSLFDAQTQDSFGAWADEKTCKRACLIFNQYCANR